MNISNDLKKILFLHISASIIFVYISIFVNLYIWETERKIFDIALFNLVNYLCLGFSYSLGTFLLTKKNYTFVMKFSSIAASISFLILSFVNTDNHIYKIIIVALSFAFMKGFYYAGNNLSIAMFGEENEISTFYFYSSIFRFGILITTPFLFWLFIYFFDYLGSFLLMFFLSLLMFYIATKIPNYSLKTYLKPNEKFIKNINFKYIMFDSLPKKWYCLSTFFYGFFWQFLIFFTIVFTFNITENKLYIAALNVIYALFTFIALKFYKKFKEKQLTWVYIGLLLVFLGFTFVIFSNSIIMLLIANILLTVGSFFFDNIIKSQHLLFVKKSNTIEKAKILMWREYLLSLSRVSLLFWALFIDDIGSVNFITMIIVAIIIGVLTPFTNYKFMQYKKKSVLD